MRVGGGMAAIAAMAGCALLALAGAAQAATFTPNRLGDHAPGDCTRSDCTLREAITRANDHVGADTIVLRAGRTYRLSLQNGAGDENLNATGDLDVRGPLAIASSAHRPATVDGAGIDRVFETDPTAAVDLTLRRVVVRGGVSPLGRGCGIDSEGGGTLELEHDSVVHNVCADNEGGGIVIAGAGKLVVKHSLVAHNRSSNDEQGGGIAIRKLAALAPKARIAHSSIVGNEAQREGGGIANEGGSLVVSTSTIAGNRTDTRDAESGGGIINEDLGDARIVRSTLAGNRSGNAGGAVANTAGSTIEITDSTLSDNLAAAQGGGFANLGGTATLVNDTITQNLAGSSGGGIVSMSGSLTSLNAVTVARNQALTGEGGGLFAVNSSAIDVRNSLLALNEVIGTGPGPDCIQEDTAAITSSGHDLVGDTTDCAAGFGPATDDVLDTDPRIAQLADNGGPTQTIALRRRSPAINRAGADAPEPR